MNRVICDVCGTTYPETAAQCPICGCAKPENARVVSGDTVKKDGKTTGSYTYVKGGRFSKGNVRKRNKAAAAARAEQDIAAVEEENDSGKSNRGLVIAVVLLLLAIAAVMLYIFLNFFHTGDPGKDKTDPVITTTTAPTTTAVDSTPAEIPCAGITLSDTNIVLENIGDSWLLNVTADPVDTTDTVTFASDNTDVATVTGEGRVTAIAAGEAVITVTCGDMTAQCTVTCTAIEETTEATTEATTEPQNTNDDWKLNRTDISFTKAGETWDLYKGSVSKDKITWSTDDAAVATFVDGVVTAVGPGTTNVHAEYNGTKYSCIVRCRIKAETTDEPTEATEGTEATEAAGDYTVYIDGLSVEKRKFKNEVTIAVGEFFQLTLRNDSGDVIAVDWAAASEGICTINGNSITGKAKGTVKISVTYGGSTYDCIVHVK